MVDWALKSIRDNDHEVVLGSEKRKAVLQGK